MASFYNAGATGYGVVGTASTSSSASTLYDRDQDIATGNVFHVCHTGTTDGTTASASWLKVKVTDIADKSFSDIVLPGKDIYLQQGLNTQQIQTIEAWTLTPDSDDPGADDVCVTIGITSKR